MGIEAAVRSRLQIELGGELCIRWLSKVRAVGKDNGGYNAFTVVCLYDELLGFGVLFDVDPFVGYLMLTKETLASPAIWTPVGAVDSYLRERHSEVVVLHASILVVQTNPSPSVDSVRTSVLCYN